MESPMSVNWLQRCATLAAWLWVVPGAGALPTFMPIDVPQGSRIDSQARLASPFTLLGQAAIAGASDAVPNGNLVYVCGNSGISVFDVTNVTTPQLLRTVGTPANTCQVRGGDRLVALRGGNTFVLSLYSLTDPRNPQRLGGTPEIPYNFAGDLAITDTHAFVTTLTFDFFNSDIFRHTGDVLSIDLSVPSAPRLDGVLLDTNGTNNDGIGVIGGLDASGGNFNMFSVAQADAQTLLVSSTTVTGGDTQAGIGLVRVLDIGAPGNLGEIPPGLQIPGAVHLIGLAIQGNRALAVASSGGWQDFFTDQNAGLSGNAVLATLDTSAPRNPRLIATRALSRASRGVNPPVSFGNDKYAFSSLGASGDTPQLFLVDATDPTNLILAQMDVPSEITRMRVQGDLLYTASPISPASPSGLHIYGMAPPPFEAELASTQLVCKKSGCRVPVTCNLAPALGTSCRNRIILFVRASGRLAEDVAAKAPRRLRMFATATANVPPGRTETVRFRLTPRGKRIVRTSKNRRLTGVMEIRNSAATAIDRTTVRVRIR